MVIDWRAPVSRPFYRASRSQPMGLALRRRFGFSGGELTAFEDEWFLAGLPSPPGAPNANLVSAASRHGPAGPGHPGPSRLAAC